MKGVSISAIFVDQMIAGAKQQGVDYAAILRRHSISELSIKQPSARVSLEAFALAAVDLMTELDDEQLGLGAKPQRLGSFNMMARACITAKTLKQSLRRYARFWNLFENTFRHQVLISSGQLFYQLNFLEGQSALNTYAWDAALSTTHRFHCWLTGQYLPLKQVTLPYAEPHYAAETKRLFYGAPIRYGGEVGVLEFDERFTDVEVVQNSQSLDTYLAGANLSLFSQPKNYRAVEDQVRQWLQKNLRLGNYHCTLARAADHLKLSQQALHRKLLAESTSFKDVKMHTRRDVALQLLSDTDYRVEEIATRVGFSEPSAFIRAFKTWTGKTPLLHRQAQRLGDQD